MRGIRQKNDAQQAEMMWKRMLSLYIIIPLRCMDKHGKYERQADCCVPHVKDTLGGVNSKVTSPWYTEGALPAGRIGQR